MEANSQMTCIITKKDGYEHNGTCMLVSVSEVRTPFHICLALCLSVYCPLTAFKQVFRKDRKKQENDGREKYICFELFHIISSRK